MPIWWIVFSPRPIQLHHFYPILNAKSLSSLISRALTIGNQRNLLLTWSGRGWSTVRQWRSAASQATGCGARPPSPATRGTGRYPGPFWNRNMEMTTFDYIFIIKIPGVKPGAEGCGKPRAGVHQHLVGIEMSTFCPKYRYLAPYPVPYYSSTYNTNPSFRQMADLVRC
jgi:hypothetical protein